MAKVELLRPSFIRPEPRPIIDLQPEDMIAFLDTREPDMFQVRNTPEIAKLCLELNREDNRAISRHKLAQIARDQGNGHFKPNGDTIKFDWDGRMYDGQKRQKAIIVSDTTQILWWSIGNDPDAHFVTDKGQKRSLSDSLRIEKYRNNTNLAAAGGWLYIIKFCNEPKGLSIKTGSDEEVFDIIKNNPGLIDSVSFFQGRRPGSGSKPALEKKRGSLIPGGLIAAMHYIGSHFLNRKDEADAFVNTITKFPREVAFPHAVNHGGKLCNPLNLWLTLLDQRKKANITVPRDVMGTGTFYAWNLYAQGKRIEQKNFRLPVYQAITGLDLDAI